MTTFSLKKRNVHYFGNQSSHRSLSADEIAEEIDLEISAVFNPVRFVHLPQELEKLTNFFYVEDLKDETA